MIERIEIQINLSGEFWDKFPMIDLILDTDVISRYTINQKKFCIKQIVDLELQKPHRLQLYRYNKFDNQCVIVENKKKDQYVIIDDIMIDGINIQNLIWSRCWYEPEYPEMWAKQQNEKGIELETKIIGETWLSHNGTWNFDFSSPFYKFVISQFRI